MTMEVSQKIEIYKDLFNNDPLFEEVKRRDLTDELFQPCVLYSRVYFDVTYSTKQAAELLEIPGKEQTLLNFLNRNDFIDYIDIDRKGKRGYWRYNNKTLFQFKLILLLTKYDLTPLDIATLVGTRPEYSSRERMYNKTPLTRLPESQGMAEMFEEQASKLVSQMSYQVEKMILDQKRALLHKDLQNWEVEMRGLVGRIEDIELIISFNQLILDGFNNTKKEQPKSFIERIFNSKSVPEPLVDNVEFQAKLSLLKERHENLVEQKDKMDSKKEDIVKAIEEINIQIKNKLVAPQQNNNSTFIDDSKGED